MMRRKDKKTNQSKLLGVIFFVVFLDMLGVTIIIPVIPALFEGEYSMFAHLDVRMRSMLYGLLIGSYSVMQFIGAPILGSLSDRHGRKPILSISLLGALAGYVVFGFAISLEILWLLYIARMIPGFMGGNIAVAYSAIADVSDEKDRPKNFGLVGAAFGLGFTIGPGVGGFLADSTLVSWFNYATPFWATAILTFVNIVLVQLYFPETLKEKSKAAISAFQGIKNIARVFSLPELRHLFSVILLMSLGFTFYTQFYAVYLYREFNFSVREVGLLFLWIGLWLVFAQGFLVRILSKRIGPIATLRLSLFFTGLFILGLFIPNEVWQLYVFNALIAVAYGISSPNLTAMVSSAASDTRQGEVLGINQSVSSLGQVFPPIIGGVLLGFLTIAPLLVSGAIVLVAAGLFIFTQRN